MTKEKLDDGGERIEHRGMKSICTQLQCVMGGKLTGWGDERARREWDETGRRWFIASLTEMEKKGKNKQQDVASIPAPVPAPVQITNVTNVTYMTPAVLGAPQPAPDATNGPPAPHDENSDDDQDDDQDDDEVSPEVDLPVDAEHDPLGTVEDLERAADDEMSHFAPEADPRPDPDPKRPRTHRAGGTDDDARVATEKLASLTVAETDDELKLRAEAALVDELLGKFRQVMARPVPDADVGKKLNEVNQALSLNLKAFEVTDKPGVFQYVVKNYDRTIGSVCRGSSKKEAKRLAWKSALENLENDNELLKSVLPFRGRFTSQ